MLQYGRLHNKGFNCFFYWSRHRNYSCISKKRKQVVFIQMVYIGIHEDQCRRGHISGAILRECPFANKKLDKLGGNTYVKTD